MAYQSVFKRYELKYLLTLDQQKQIIDAMEDHMAIDHYGHTRIRNIYYDTDNFRLIRSSLDKPLYKEKLRLRSYAPCSGADPVFLELKKKYDGIVYKRRLQMPYDQAVAWLSGDLSKTPDSQIGREVAWFMEFYKDLKPKVFLSYERQAWYSLDGSDFRVTFDRNIQSRTEYLQLTSPCSGTILLPENTVLMELKTSGGIPLWMTNILTRNQIYKTSFSKYGTAYQKTIFKGGTEYARSVI